MKALNAKGGCIHNRYLILDVVEDAVEETSGCRSVVFLVKHHIFFLACKAKVNATSENLGEWKVCHDAKVKKQLTLLKMGCYNSSSCSLVGCCCNTPSWWRGADSTLWGCSSHLGSRGGRARVLIMRTISPFWNFTSLVADDYFCFDFSKLK